MNIIESLRKVESRIFADRNESVNLVDMYLTNSKNIDKAKLQEMLENNNTNGVIKLLNRANRKSLKEDYYTVKYYYYTDDNQIEEDGHTFDNAQDAKAFSDSIKSSFKDSLIRLDWDIHDENMTRDWELLDRKTITDFDGFTTDYTLWKKIDEDYWVCVFGDSDIYGPEDGEFDAEFDTEREAREWFDDYNGFEYELDESLKEAHLGPYKYKYEVYWVSPHTGENSLLGASKTYEGAVDIAKNQINEIASNPWENKKNKIKFIQTTTIADADFDFLEDEEELADYKDKVIASLNESLKEYIDSTILSDQTLSMLEEGDHLVDGNKGWQILEIEVRGNKYLPNRERVWLELIGKNGIKKYTTAGTLYGYKIVEKSKAPKSINAYDRDSNVLGENLKEDWEDESHGTSDKKASMERVEKFVDLVSGDLKSTKDGGAIITWDGGKIVAKGLQDLFSKVEKAYKKMQKSMKEDIDWSKSFATMSDEEIRKEISKMNEKSDKEYLQDYLDHFNAIYKQEGGKHIIELPYDEDIVEDSFEDLMYDVKYNLHEMSLDGSL